MIKEREIFVIGTYPDTEEKLEILKRTIREVKVSELPVIITTHYYPLLLDEEVNQLVDFIIYDKSNVIGDWRLNYWIIYPKFLKIVGKMQGMGYHAVACLSLIMNSVLFCRDKYNIIHYIESDVEFDVLKYLKAARSSLETHSLFGFEYELGKRNLGLPYSLNGIRTNIFSFRTNWYYYLIPDVRTWEEYEHVANTTGERVDLILEFWIYHILKSKRVLDQCSIVDAADIKQFVTNMNLLDTGKTDPKLKIFSSELDNNKDVILFIINEAKEDANFIIKNIENGEISGVCKSKHVYYNIFPKSSGRYQIFINNNLSKEYNFNNNSNNDFLECTFRFYDDRIKCLKWNSTDDCNFIP